jgi:hypothetical protein
LEERIFNISGKDKEKDKLDDAPRRLQVLQQGKVVGDSPELCRSLDAYGFSDLEAAITYNVSMSTFLPKADPRRLSMHTPAALFETMKLCWDFCEPTSERIVQDIEGFDRALEMIIEAKGTIVKAEGLRHGRRAARHNGKGELTTRLRSSQRKATLKERPLLPQLKMIHDQFMASDTGVFNFIEAQELLNKKIEEAKKLAILEEEMEDEHGDDERAPNERFEELFFENEDSSVEDDEI